MTKHNRKASLKKPISFKSSQKLCINCALNIFTFLINLTHMSQSGGIKFSVENVIYGCWSIIAEVRKSISNEKKGKRKHVDLINLRNKNVLTREKLLRLKTMTTDVFCKSMTKPYLYSMTVLHDIHLKI